MIQIKAPDGSIAQFPDDTSDATIQAVMAKTYGGPNQPPADREIGRSANGGVTITVPSKLVRQGPPMSIPMQRATADAKADIAKLPPDKGGLNFFNGMYMNFAPELDAGASALETGAGNLLRTVTGQPKPYGMSDMFEARRALDRQQIDQFSKDHPVQNIAANLSGALFNPANAAAGAYVGSAAGIPTAMLRGAVTGAPIGAAYGAGAAGPGRRIPGAVRGGVTGAVTGALAPPVAAGVGAALRKVGGMASDVTSGVGNLLNPPDPEAAASGSDTTAAMAKLSDLLRARGVTPDSLTTADPFGKGLTTAEAVGRPGVMSLGALARRSGTTPDSLESVLRDRASGAPSRILDDFASVSGIHPEEAAGDVEALAGRLKGEAGPLFDAVRAHEGPVWSPELAQIAERPVVKKAIGAAATDLLNAGKNPTQAGFLLDPDTGAYVLNTDLSKATEQQPTAETWDLIRQRIGDQVERHPMSGKILPDSVSRGNYNINVAKRDLTNVLAGDPAHGEPGLVPGYRAALDKAGDYLGLQSAFQRGQDAFLNPNISAKSFAQTYGGLSEPDQKAWTAGIASKLSDQMQKGRLTPRQLLLPHVQDKLEAVLGSDGLAALVPRLQAEAQLASTGGRMMPGAGSPTMEFLNGAAEQDSGPGVLSILARGARHPVQAVGDLASQGKTLGTSPQLRNELGRLLMQRPQVTAAELMAAPPPAQAPLIPRLPYDLAPVAAGSAAGKRK